MITYEKYAEIRNSKGMRDADVARAAKIPPSTFTEWKKGEYTPKFDKMCKIADALGMIYMELINEEGEGLPQDADYLVEKPNLPGDPAVAQEAIDLSRRIQNLPKERQAALLDYLRFLESDS